MSTDFLWIEWNRLYDNGPYRWVLVTTHKTPEGPLDLDVLTGLSSGQRLVLYGRCRELIGQVAKPVVGRPVIDLYRSVMLVVCLMRRNGTQEFTGAIFGASQSTVSRRW